MYGVGLVCVINQRTKESESVKVPLYPLRAQPPWPREHLQNRASQGLYQSPVVSIGDQAINMQDSVVVVVGLYNFRL